MNPRLDRASALLHTLTASLPSFERERQHVPHGARHFHQWTTQDPYLPASPPAEPFCASIAWWRSQYVGLDPTQSTELASTLREPVSVTVEAKDPGPSVLFITMIDGRHRSTSAYEAGAARILARIRGMWLGQFAGEWVGLVPLPIGQHEVQFSTNREIQSMTASSASF